MGKPSTWSSRAKRRHLDCRRLHPPRSCPTRAGCTSPMRRRRHHRRRHRDEARHRTRPAGLGRSSARRQRADPRRRSALRELRRGQRDRCHACRRDRRHTAGRDSAGWYPTAVAVDRNAGRCTSPTAKAKADTPTQTTRRWRASTPATGGRLRRRNLTGSLRRLRFQATPNSPPVERPSPRSARRMRTSYRRAARSCAQASDQTRYLRHQRKPDYDQVLATCRRPTAIRGW